MVPARWPNIHTAVNLPWLDKIADMENDISKFRFKKKKITHKKSIELGLK